MDDGSPGIDSALWRIAELGARCGQRSAGADRRAMWTELEALIAGLGGELQTAREGEPSAAAEVRRLRQELEAAVRERDEAVAAAIAERDAAVAARKASTAASRAVIRELAARAEGRRVRAVTPGR